MSQDGYKDYRAYVTDQAWYSTYSDYQKRYADNPRESDKKTARLVLQSLAEMRPSARPRILDIGCSTGNFLKHLRRLLPEADLVGGDLMAPVVAECRSNPDLEGIRFEVMDVFAIPPRDPFDVIIANAVNVYFDTNEYEAALVSIANALCPNGVFIAYEWISPGDQEIRIVERSQGHAEGLKFYFRAETSVRKALTAAGFNRVEIEPFDIPVDLPKPEPTGTDADLVTYTVRSRDGCRLMFRGALCQPWCHLRGRKIG